MSADISVKRTTESTKRSTEAGEPVIELSKKSTSKIKWGLFKVSGQRNVGKYCYIPSSLLTKSDFNFDDVFGALKIPTPQLVFHINGAGDVKTWNLKLPVYRSNLVGAKHQTLMSAQLEHYQGVVRENCKRLLKGTATACKQAGAIFKLDGLFDDQDAGAQIGRWLAEGSSVPRLSMAGTLKKHYFCLFQSFTKHNLCRRGRISRGYYVRVVIQFQSARCAKQRRC